jgi:hypothetical protein
MKITEMVKQAQKNLDEFNLEVAQFRVEHGMSTSLTYLYKEMGLLSRGLMALESQAEKVERLDAASRREGR